MQTSRSIVGELLQHLSSINLDVVLTLGVRFGPDWGKNGRPCHRGLVLESGASECIMAPRHPVWTGEHRLLSVLGNANDLPQKLPVAVAQRGWGVSQPKGPAVICQRSRGHGWEARLPQAPSMPCTMNDFLELQVLPKH